VTIKKTYTLPLAQSYFTPFNTIAMPPITVPPPENLQLQSALVRLPLEIKYMIVKYCFAADRPIVDAVVGRKTPASVNMPGPSINLLQTCRRLYHETDRRPLFFQNTFRFTSVDKIRAFFASLGDACTASVRDVEIDVQRVHSDHSGMAREWRDYLAWGSGAWAKTLGSLHEEAPNLKCLRLNFQAWPTIPLQRAELWSLLGNMLSYVEGLERIIVTGASKGSGMARREPWSPVHFVGGDDVGTNDLVQHMWKTVGSGSANDEQDKMIRWTRENRKLQLEVVTKSYLVKDVDLEWNSPMAREKHTDPWPEQGTCTWLAYHFRDSEAIGPTKKEINPSAVE
jgi:hypothetical protein